jgi:hypothetical protein
VDAQTQQLHEQLEQLQEELATRQSILHFAHTGVALVVAGIVAGASGKLFWDSVRTPWLAWLGVLATAGLVVHALVRYRRGRQVLKVELERYQALLELRRRLRLDNPSTLLPR